MKSQYEIGSLVLMELDQARVGPRWKWSMTTNEWVDNGETGRIVTGEVVEFITHNTFGSSIAIDYNNGLKDLTVYLPTEESSYFPQHYLEGYAYAKRPARHCECGGESVGTTCTYWCPKYEVY